MVVPSDGPAPSSAAEVTTDVDGHAEYTYLGRYVGTDTITVWLDRNLDGTADPDEPQATLSKEWIAVERLFGTDRLLTAVDISQDSYGDDQATAVVLARADDFADALAGTPFAVANDAPMLLTFPDTLAASAADEMARVLPDGATVYLLGGENALSGDVADAVTALGFVVDRIQGQTRIETSIEVAHRLGDPATLLVTTGYDFPDALSAGAAAANADGAVVLSTAEVPHPSTTAYLDSQPAAEVFAVGGPAARAYPGVTAVFGPSREETAIAVAEEFFESPTVVGLARRDRFADALTGGAHIAGHGGPMLLTPQDHLHAAVIEYLCAGHVLGAFLYGGEAALTADVADAVPLMLDGTGCPA